MFLNTCKAGETPENGTQSLNGLNDICRRYSCDMNWSRWSRGYWRFSHLMGVLGKGKADVQEDCIGIKGVVGSLIEEYYQIGHEGNV